LLTSDLNAQDSAIVSFSIGNKYAFQGNIRINYESSGSPYSYSEFIIGDTIIDGRHYFKFFKPQGPLWGVPDTIITFRRADSFSVYQYNILYAYEDTIFNFKDIIGTVYHYDDAFNYYTLISKDSIYIFGERDSTIGILYRNGSFYRYASKLFLINFDVYNLLYEVHLELRGAIINGVYYCDSTLVSVNSQLNTNLSDYALYQNYPNPFNPLTTISFTLPSRSFVTLKIFDLLGREVATIVSEELSVGNYSRQWNASNISSGIYFYRLQAGSFIETKKLIFLK